MLEFRSWPSCLLVGCVGLSACCGGRASLGWALVCWLVLLSGFLGGVGLVGNCRTCAAVGWGAPSLSWEDDELVRRLSLCRQLSLHRDWESPAAQKLMMMINFLLGSDCDSCVKSLSQVRLQLGDVKQSRWAHLPQIGGRQKSPRAHDLRMTRAWLGSLK